MKKLKQYAIGNIVLIRRDDDTLEFNGKMQAKDPKKVMIAMIKLGKYLKWWSPKDHKTSADIEISWVSKNRLMCLNGKKRMHLCVTGNTDALILSRDEIQVLAMLMRKNPAKAKEAMLDSELYSFTEDFIWIEKLPDYVEFETEEEWKKADEAFLEFMNSTITGPGKYQIPVVEFEKVVPTNLIWTFLVNRFEGQLYGHSRRKFPLQTVAMEGGNVLLRV